MKRKDISFNTILRILSILLHIPGLMAVFSLIIPLIFGENYAYFPFLLTAAVSIGGGQLLYHLTKKKYDPNLSHSLMAVALGWLIVPVIGALPIYLIAKGYPVNDVVPKTVADFQYFFNSFFESQSGFTSTGLTMASDPSQLPKSIQWWRSFMEWIGGAGMILFIISAFKLDVNDYNVYYAEGREDKIGGSVHQTAILIWWIYLAYTAFAILLFFIIGMPVWEAVNHGFTAISTGGFTITEASISVYSDEIKIAVIFVMLLGAISFNTHYSLLRKGEYSVFWKHQQARYFLFLIAAGSIFIISLNLFNRYSISVIDSVFQWSSALGTCGFSSTPVKNLGTDVILALVFAMIIGGSAGSTTGGIKISRFIIFASWVKRNVGWVIEDPEKFKEADAEGDKQRAVDRRFIASAILTFLWVALIVIGVMILVNAFPYETRLSHILFDSASAFGSVGLSTGLTGPEMPLTGKIIFILFMWLGRLEIIPGIILISGIIKMIKSVFTK